MEKRNVTIGGNLTELQEFVTYEITQLRMDPDYIRSQIYTLYTYTARGGIHWVMHPWFPKALEIYRSHQDKSWGPLEFPSGLWVKTNGLGKSPRRQEGFLDTSLVYVSPIFSSLIHSSGCIRKYEAIRIGSVKNNHFPENDESMYDPLKTFHSLLEKLCLSWPCTIKNDINWTHLFWTRLLPVFISLPISFETNSETMKNM